MQETQRSEFFISIHKAKIQVTCDLLVKLIFTEEFFMNVMNFKVWEEFEPTYKFADKGQGLWHIVLATHFLDHGILQALHSGGVLLGLNIRN